MVCDETAIQDHQRMQDENTKNLDGFNPVNLVNSASCS